jgi:anti-sigma factor RsiW
MKLVEFPDGACEKTRRFLDSYIDNELPREAAREVERHLEDCGKCPGELETRRRIKERVRLAASQVPVPAGLELRVHHAIRDYERRQAGTPNRYWLMSAAAVVLLAFVAWRGTRFVNARTELAQFLQIGVVDHEECAVPRSYAEAPPTQAEFVTDLGPKFQELLPVVRGRVPEAYRLEQAHQCTVEGRSYVHFIFRKAPALISLILTKKSAAEAFPRQVGELVSRPLDRYQATGGEAGSYFFYVVSNIAPEENRQLAASLSGPVREYLAGHAAAGLLFPGW